MSTFVLAFGFFVIVMAGMAIGVMLSGRTIKGSCGGLNAVEGADLAGARLNGGDAVDRLVDQVLQAPKVPEMPVAV